MTPTQHRAWFIVSCYKAGVSRHSIAKMLGISLRRVNYRLRVAGVWPPTEEEYQAARAELRALIEEAWNRNCVDDGFPPRCHPVSPA